jgi:hypothetical protein
MEDRPQRWKQSAALRSVALLLLLVSPLGAPIVGYLIIDACDIPWEGPFQCAVPTPLLHYFTAFTILPFIWVGPFLAILWLMMSCAVLLGCLWYAARAVWQATMDRP